jgi:pimeloyl-ACP methyl ester carboxylesterase
MCVRLLLGREGVDLSCIDFGGSGSTVVLLHGLAGHAGEWAETASWLTQLHRVVALDARGHGASERNPDDVSPAAHITDAVLVIEELDLAPVVLVGQSLGGRSAFMTAAARSDLVRALVVVEATPESGTPAEVDEQVDAIAKSLARWPVPFASKEAAVEFWGGPSVKSEAWVSGLEARGEELWPRFDLEIMTRTLREAISSPSWHEWDSLNMETLLVRGADGPIPRDIFTSMVQRLPGSHLVEISDAGHDLHLDQPDRWKNTLTDFLRWA